MANQSTNGAKIGGNQAMYGVKEPIRVIDKDPIQALYGPAPQPKSTFTITDATQGRSVAGSATLKNEFNASVNALIKVLNGDKYAAFKKTINANWVGADATDFLNDVEKTRAELEKSLKTLTAKFNAAVEADAKQFSNFQSKNVK